LRKILAGSALKTARFCFEDSRTSLSSKQNPLKKERFCFEDSERINAGMRMKDSPRLDFLVDDGYEASLNLKIISGDQN
jgi:hypothetical protein